MRALRQENDLRDGGSFGSQGAQLLEAVLRCAWDGSPISDVAHVSSAGVSDSSEKKFHRQKSPLDPQTDRAKNNMKRVSQKKKFRNFASKFLLQRPQYSI